MQKLEDVYATNRDDPTALKLAIDAVGHAKPWLILVPGVLITQWAKEATKMSAFFKIFVYHTERKRSDIMADIGSKDRPELISVDYTRVSKPLERGSKVLRDIMFGGDDDYSKITLVITTQQTLTIRHGPSALSKRRIARYKRELAAGRLGRREFERRVDSAREGTPNSVWNTRDKKWNRDLSGIFGGLVIDEAHAYRNPHSQAMISVLWLRPDVTFGLTATPVYHTHRDVLGYLTLLQLPQSCRLQSVFDNEDLGHFSDGYKSQSPYDPKFLEKMTKNGMLDKATRQRSLTMSAFKKYVCSKDPVSEPHEGLGRVFEDILVRTNYDSSLPHHTPEHSIGRKLPTQIRYTREAELSQDWKKVFDLYTKNAYKRIRMPLKSFGRSNGRNTGAMAVNSNSHRHATLATDFPFTMLIGIPRDHSCIYATEHKRIGTSRKEFYARARQAYRQSVIKQMRKEADEDEEKQWSDFELDKDPPEDWIDMSQCPSK